MVAPFDPTEDELTLCCGGSKCPVISQDSGGFSLKDDGVAIRLSREQAALLALWIEAKLRGEQKAAAMKLAKKLDRTAPLAAE